MSLERNAAVSTSALDLLFEQFKGKANFSGLVAALVAAGGSAAVQELEDVAAEIISKNVLATATGEQLARYARIVGCPGGYTSDGDLRTAIYLQIAINVSQGDPERLTDITQRIDGAAFVQFVRKGYATVNLYSHQILRWGQLARVQKAATGGVRVVHTGSPSADVFVFGADRDAAGVEHGAELDYGIGFDEVAA